MKQDLWVVRLRLRSKDIFPHNYYLFDPRITVNIVQYTYKKSK